MVKVMKQKSLAKVWSVLMVAMLLSACDSIPFLDTSSDYKGAGRAKPLEVPPDLTAVQTSDAYSVPGGSTSYSAYSQAQEGQEAGVEKVLATPDGVRIEKAGSQRWLVVNAAAEKIWPVVREFWLDQGFAVRVENADTGVMETEWVDADAIKTKDDKRGALNKFDAWLDKLSGLADRRKFRTRLERGQKEGTTEIYMTHRTVAGAPDDGKNVVQTNVGKIDTGYRLGSDKEDPNAKADQLDNEIDSELMRRLMVKLGLAQKQADQVVANAVIQKRAEVVKESDSSVTLLLADPYDRGWRRVGLALDRIGFVTEDKDRSNGLYYVRYTDVDIDSGPTKKKGFFDSLKFWGKDDAEEQPKAKDDKSVLDKLKFWKGDEGKTDPSKQYRIKLIEKDDNTTQVNVVTEDGKHNRSSTANRIVQMLYEQLK